MPFLPIGGKPEAMKKINIYLERLRTACKKIHLVDKCLILFMSVLLLQSAYTLFFVADSSSDIANIDIIVRTSAASIFGYFLSANFIRNTTDTISTGSAKEQIRVQVGCEESAKNLSDMAPQMLDVPDIPQLADIPEVLENTPPTATATRLQIISATAIGLFCLLSLLLLRDFSQMGVHATDASGSVTATVTQFRDFISGCVGFLIGCPTDTHK